MQRVKGEFNEEKAEKLRAGVVIDGKKTAPAKVKILKAGENFTDVRIVIHEGRNRQVKKMFTSVGCFVTALKRNRRRQIYTRQYCAGDVQGVYKGGNCAYQNI